MHVATHSRFLLNGWPAEAVQVLTSALDLIQARTSGFRQETLTNALATHGIAVESSTERAVRTIVCGHGLPIDLKVVHLADGLAMARDDIGMFNELETARLLSAIMWDFRIETPLAIHWTCLGLPGDDGIPPSVLTEVGAVVIQPFGEEVEFFQAREWVEERVRAYRVAQAAETTVPGP